MLLCAGAVLAEQRIALVIGNAAYPTARLQNPVNDATAIAAKLKTLGFDVTLKTDVSQREMTRALSQFGQKLTPGSVGLFYFAGHGMQVRGKNFLIPVDAEIQTEASVRSESIDLDQLLDQLGPVRLGIVILDACRNNPFERRFRGAQGGGLAQVDAPKGTLLAYATAPGKVASDGTGSNGLYTAALLKSLDQPGLKVEDVFKAVRINVMKATGEQQIPWESSSLTGDFYFRAGERRVAPGTASPRGGWRQRMAALEAERGNLTVSNILAVLFDYRKDEELERAVKWQRFHKSLPYHSAYAIGINPRGRIITGAAWNRRNEQFASDAAMDWCTQKAEKNTCRIVMTNDLRRKEFLDVLKQLAERDYPALRHDVLQLRVERPA